jgi:hypothetical protein
MRKRPRHPNKEIEAAVASAESKGWTCRMQGHWGRLYCPHSDRNGCQVGVSGTPKNPGNHARQITRAVERCPHGKEDNEESNEDV